jgi:hypothetical protein
MLMLLTILLLAAFVSYHIRIRIGMCIVSLLLLSKDPTDRKIENTVCCCQ